MSSEKVDILETRRIGEYGHFVMPLRQILADLTSFLSGVELESVLSEIVRIGRADQGVHPEEAAILYALVRAIKPTLVLETGTFSGYSTTEIARALHANQSGHLLTVDIDINTGCLVPEELKPLITFYRGITSHEFSLRLAKSDERVDIFFHDSLHTYMNTMGELIWFSPFYQHDCLIICHDAKMDWKPEYGVGRAVREFAEALCMPYLILDTTCGLAVMRWTDQISKETLNKLRSGYVRLEKTKRVSDLLYRIASRLASYTGLT